MLSDNDIRKFGFESGLLRLKGATITRWKDGIDIDYPVQEVEQFARAIELAAYERAAKACEKHFDATWSTAAISCAAAIRALAAKETK